MSHANLAVWTTHMVMLSVPFSMFQKGVERIIGRALGVFAGLTLHALFPNVLVLQIVFEGLLIALAFYIYFAGRLAYTALNAGLYLVAILAIAQLNPDRAAETGWELFYAIVLGVMMAYAVNWLTGAEQTVAIATGETPLWPVRGDLLNRAAMLSATALLTQFAARWLELPSTQAIISVMFLSISADLPSVILKGKLRLIGGLYGAGWAYTSIAILTQVDHFLVLAGLLFFGMFVAAYLARTGGTNAYAGVQMGLVLPLVLVLPASEFGSLAGAWQRFEGVLVALAVTMIVAALWPRFPTRSADHK